VRIHHTEPQDLQPQEYLLIRKNAEPVSWKKMCKEPQTAIAISNAAYASAAQEPPQLGLINGLDKWA